MVTCEHCGQDVETDMDPESLPHPEDDEAWAEIEAEHAVDCPWAQSHGFAGEE